MVYVNEFLSPSLLAEELLDVSRFHLCPCCVIDGVQQWMLWSASCFWTVDWHIKAQFLLSASVNIKGNGSSSAECSPIFCFLFRIFSFLFRMLYLLFCKTHKRTKVEILLRSKSRSVDKRESGWQKNCESYVIHFRLFATLFSITVYWKEHLFWVVDINKE